MKLKMFTSFTEEDIDRKLDDFSFINIEEDIPYLFRNDKEIELLFKYPESFKDGKKLRFKIQKLMEAYFLLSITKKNVEFQDALINVSIWGKIPRL